MARFGRRKMPISCCAVLALTLVGMIVCTSSLYAHGSTSAAKAFSSLYFPRRQDVLDCVHATPAALPSRDFELRRARRQVQLLGVLIPLVTIPNCSWNTLILEVPERNMRLRIFWTRPCVCGHVYRCHSTCESMCNADCSGEDHVDHI
jgi:hypothetical protein